MEDEGDFGRYWYGEVERCVNAEGCVDFDRKIGIVGGGDIQLCRDFGRFCQIRAYVIDKQERGRWRFEQEI